jgi:hypothetical protein
MVAQEEEREQRMKKTTWWLAGVAVVLLATPAMADLIDPATLHVGTTASLAFAGGGDPQFVTSGKFSVAQESGKGVTLGIPLDLIIAVPIINGAGVTDPFTELSGAHLDGSVTPVTLSNVEDAPFAGSLVNPSGDDQTELKTTSSSNIYGAVGLGGPGVDKSLNVANLEGGYFKAGILGCTNATCSGSGLDGWELFAIEGEIGLGAKAALDVLDSLPVGTYIAPYAQDASGKVYVTQFTNVGLVTDLSVPPVPLPGALPMFIGGLTGLGVLARWRKHRMTS